MAPFRLLTYVFIELLAQENLKNADAKEKLQISKYSYHKSLAMMNFTVVWSPSARR